MFKRVCIVIPALNEASTIAVMVKAVGKFGVTVVVDDGSSDRTAELALESGAVVVAHEKNLGYDAALNSGFIKAADLGVQIIITVDADGQHDPSQIQRFVDAIDAGADVVIGIRDRRQRCAEHLFAWYAGFRFRVQDPLCGMKAYRTTVYQRLGHFDSYGSIGTELTFFAVKRGYRIDQIPLNVRQRIGESRFGQILSGNLKIIRAMIYSICI